MRSTLERWTRLVPVGWQRDVLFLAGVHVTPFNGRNSVSEGREAEKRQSNRGHGTLKAKAFLPPAEPKNNSTSNRKERRSGIIGYCDSSGSFGFRINSKEENIGRDESCGCATAIRERHKHEQLGPVIGSGASARRFPRTFWWAAIEFRPSSIIKNHLPRKEETNSWRNDGTRFLPQCYRYMMFLDRAGSWGNLAAPTLERFKCLKFSVESSDERCTLQLKIYFNFFTLKFLKF